MIVRLMYAPLPVIGAVAVHYWFVTLDDAGACHRWEVWQTPNAGGKAVGHVHCDLKPADENVGGSPTLDVHDTAHRTVTSPGHSSGRPSTPVRSRYAQAHAPGTDAWATALPAAALNREPGGTHRTTAACRSRKARRRTTALSRPRRGCCRDADRRCLAALGSQR